MIRAHWLRILLFAVIGGVVALIISRLIPPKYEAQVSLKVDQSMPATALTDTNQGQTVVDKLQFDRPRSIETQVAQLESLGTLTTAARAVASDFNLPDPAANARDELNPLNLQNDVNVIASQQSDIIDMDIRLSSPDLAQDAAKQIYLAFVGENADSTKEMAQRAIESLRSQTTQIDQQLADIDKQVSDLRAQTGMTDPTTQVTAEITGLTTLKQQRDQAGEDQAAAHKSVEVLAQELAETPKKLTGTESSGPNPLYEKLQEDLITAQSDRAAMLQMYDPTNEQVKAADDRIHNIEGELHKIPATIDLQSNQELNQTYQALQQQLATARAVAEGADQKFEVAQKQVDQKEAFLKTLPPIQTKLAALDRQKLALEKIYFGYQDELKTLEAAKEGRTSPTQMLSQPIVQPEPVSPKPWINMLFGIIIGALIGWASATVLETKRQPIRSLVQLNGLSHEPVYRTVPELREPFRGKLAAPHESYETLLVPFMRSGNRPYRMAVVGLNRDSGASTAALNVAIAAARHGAKVLYVQCDPKGALGRIGHSSPKLGEFFEAMPSVKAVSTGTILDVSSAQDGIDSHVLAQEGDLSVIDVEPVSQSAEFAFVAPHVDEVLLFVRAGKARAVDFLQAQQALTDAGCKRVTVVFTRSSDFSVSVDAVESDDNPTNWPTAQTSVLPAATKAEPVPSAQAVDPLRESEPVSADPKVEANKPEAEEPARRVRTKPTVTVEDFGSIARVKPDKPLSKTEPLKEPASKPRRGSIDTSEIDS